MTYEEIVEKVRKRLEGVDTSKVNGFLAIQVNITGEGEGAFYVEVKDYKGKPREGQVHFHKMLNRYGIIHGIARSADDAVKIVKEGLIGYGF